MSTNDGKVVSVPSLRGSISGRPQPRGLGSLVFGIVIAVPAGAYEGRIDTGRVPTRPPTPVMHIAEPRSGRLTEPPAQITVFFQRFEEDLNGSSMELWIDGVEHTESLRFWTDRAWLDLPPTFTWSGGSHVIEALVRDGTGSLFRDVVTFEIEPLRGASYIWPFAYNTPNVVANLLEDYQHFALNDPGNDPYWHHGLDIRADAGSEVRAVIGGYVAYRGCYAECSSLQRNVTILGDDNFLWQYSHLTNASISGWSVGDRVEQGEVVGNIVTWCGQCWTNGSPYDHLHLNAVEWEGFDPIAWREMAEDPEQTPPAVAAPLSANFKWHNPLLFLTGAGDEDAVTPDFIGESNNSAPDIVFVVNNSDTGITATVDDAPKLSGNVDICAHLSDERDELPGLSHIPDGQPYTLGLYEIAYSVVPLNPGCFKGWIPRTKLDRFDTVPGEYDVALQDLLLLDVFQRYIEFGMQTFDTRFEYIIRNFWYNVTNAFYGTLDGEKGYWNTDGATIQGPLFPDGDYRVTVYAVDFAGNEVSQSVDVLLDNGLEPGGFCPTRITHLALPDFELHDPTGGFISAAMPPVPVGFNQIAEGSAVTTPAAADWPPLYFDDPAAGLRVAVGILCGNEATIEYVPYLGDVILDVPAESQPLPLVIGAPPPEFDCNAPSTNPVTLRISTRLARRPDTGQALLGAPHGLDQTDFQLVAAELIDVNGESRLLRTAPSGDASWVISVLGDCDGDGALTLDDYGPFVSCLTGPDAGSVPATCGRSDLDGDLDVDLYDFGASQSAFSVP